MIETLLWACPICKIEDTISHESRKFRNDRIACSACQSTWDLIRVIGGPDFRLRLLSEEGDDLEKPLAEWYDEIKSNLKLKPIKHLTWPLSNDSRPLDDETLFLCSTVLMGFATAGDPIFEQKPSVVGAGPMGMSPIGPGQLYFTSHRLICKLINNLTLHLRWQDLRSVDTLIDKFFNVSFSPLIGNSVASEIRKP